MQINRRGWLKSIFGGVAALAIAKEHEYFVGEGVTAEFPLALEDKVYVYPEDWALVAAQMAFDDGKEISKVYWQVVKDAR